MLIETSTNVVQLINDAAVFVIIGGVANLFSWFEKALDVNKRKALSAWLKSVQLDATTETWAAIFPNLIDKVFGERPLSWRFILRSCFASFIAVLTVSILLIGRSMLRSARDGWRFLLGDAVLFVMFLLISLISNLIPDYVSLLITRWIVKLMARHSRPWQIALLLIADTSLTFVNAMASVVVGAFMFLLANTSIGDVDFSLAKVCHSVNQIMVSWRWTGFAKIPPGEPWPVVFIVIFFYASFFTSVWVWLYVISAVVIKVLHKANISWQRLWPFLNIDEKPLTSVGRVAGILAGGLYAIYLSGSWILSRL